MGKESYVTLIDETMQRYSFGGYCIDCPFFTEKTEALCMDDTLYDLVIRNIDGSKLPDISHIWAHSELLGQFRESDLGCNTLDFMMMS